MFTGLEITSQSSLKSENTPNVNLSLLLVVFSLSMLQVKAFWKIKNIYDIRVLHWILSS